ncbi:MAG: class I SAM-dependent methyltransferase [Lachnospiraceae bacterium]|nr:class I SAM-dependent methyltransferase [Lachnospiraceae bacterium]
MNEYLAFSRVYDTFMDDIPYEEWFEYIHNTLVKYEIENGIIAELGCGTGTMTEMLAKSGYDMIGIDNSMEMLEIAMDKRVESGFESILYLNQDMCEFELYGTVKAIVSVCDSINYVLNEEDLIQTFKLVNNYLEPDGIFLFDFTTEKKYLDIKDATIAENSEEGSFIWENIYYEEEKINEYQLTLFLPDNHGKYDKYCEIHQQRAYTLEEMISYIELAGMQVITTTDNYSDKEVDDESARIVIVARK